MIAMNSTRLLRQLKNVLISVKKTYFEFKLPREAHRILCRMSVDFDKEKDKWLAEEIRIRKELICLPDEEDETELKYPFKIGGADLSFLPNDNDKAVCCYVVLEYTLEDQKNPEIVWKDLKLVDLSKYNIAILLFGTFQ